MPLDPIKNYQLDQTGVIVDQDPILAPPGALVKAQNATNDLYGEHGSLRKRPGLANFNSTATGSSVTGGIGVPILLGSAGPSIGNPFAGEAITVATLTAQTSGSTATIFGPGPLLGSGTTFDDNAFEYVWDENFDFSEIPYTQWLDYVGLNNTQQLDVSGDNQKIQATTATTTVGLAQIAGNNTSWTFTATSDGLQSDNSILTPLSNISFLGYPTQPIRSIVNFPLTNWNNSQTGSQGDTHEGHVATVTGNIMYYTPSNAPLSVRAYDGFHDTVACTLPNGVAVVSILGANNVVYIASIDVAATGAHGGTSVGSVYQFTPATSALIKLGATFPTGHVPYSMTWAYSRLWVGTYITENTADNDAAKVYWIRPGLDTTFTLDNTFAAFECGITGLAVFQGLIYAATVSHHNITNLVINLYVRSTAGVWSVSDSVTDAGITPAFDRGYAELLVWPSENGPVTSPVAALYSLNTLASNQSIASVRKFNGSSWSAVATLNAKHSKLNQVFVTNPSTNAIVPVICASSTAGVAVSTDGASFTDITSALQGSPGGSGIGGILIQVPL